jgi:hypothetical protein
MKRVIGLLPAICSLAVVMACTDSPTAPSPSPTAPSPDSGPPPGPTASIAMRLTPASGANVEVFECSPFRVCTGMDQLTAVFDVVVDRDIPDAVVVAWFMDGPRNCAFASVRQSFVAGTPVEVVMRNFALSDAETEGQLFCPLPVTTTAVRVEILRRNAGVGPAYLHHYSQLLPHAYTFAWPE